VEAKGWHSRGYLPHFDSQDIVQADYWDRFIRNDDHYGTIVSYIDQNPVKAGLAKAPHLWPWGSARFKAP